MTGWSAPTRDTLFVLNDVLGVTDCELPGYDALDEDTVQAVVEGMGKFCTEVLAPLNPVADAQGCTRHDDGSVTTPEGFKEAYAQLVESGWNTLAAAEEYGGQGMPHVLGTVFEEYMNSACPGFMMYPGIVGGATSTIIASGSDHLKDSYVPKIISGEWLATMALTEGHAGTDLGLMRTKAEPRGNGTYALSGEKIFISGGEHDLTDNIVHLVLARVPDAPAGSRGISLFLVPKILPDGERNTLSCAAIEHKMGLNGSATCVMNFDGATGWLLGEENAGLAAMFIMMNAARLGVGVQGLAHAEHAYQRAAAYALERMQGRAMGERPDPSAPADSLLVHPDVRRLLLDARAFAEGFRALVLWTAMQIDRSHTAPSKEERQEADALVSFLTPVIKAYGTDRGFETAVDMQQVFGGHGYVKEWGMEQIVRDARIGMIYEGANGVQAMDLAGRKLAKDGGQVATRFAQMVEAELADAPEWIAAPMGAALADTAASARWILEHAAEDPNNLGAASYAFMEMIGVVAIGWMWVRMVKAVDGRDDDFATAKRVTARHYVQQALPETAALRRRIEAGAENLMALPAEEFVRQV
ncbi:acyl-CoA dehydrogenase C-terminal domain-containing protein [Aurantiacibacter sp. MUD11]|uniref:acyl-CoA dehydrogenase C-terminal domain-containing protein n=1 Tax=Aurantiacibacter sp. MUD11 TaxID=3003265 RepID=UPI0022AB3D22|nr:acyl-CoA dehydrogenase C-terminal domain-containing protein [Aurantiacibacter sp. MUD11]WAT18394.1 acyl-CoA dehydrogenase C-terminal domain-containing protein [Aurantiacibacter sp. MUD11]